MISSIKNAIETIQQTFETEFAAAQPTVRRSYDNAKFDPPVEWVRLTISIADSFQASLGASGQRIFRHPGIATVQVFTPIGDGRKRADELAESAMPIFRARNLLGIQFRGSTPDPVGRTGGYYQLNVTTAFFFDLTF